jgi:hypothetical protein
MMRCLLVFMLLSLVVACSDSAGSQEGAGPGGGSLDGAPEPGVFDSGSELRVTVPESGRVFMKLSPPSIVTVTGDPEDSLDWDLAFEGFDIFTNSGPSGKGSAGAMGPLDAKVFADGVAPEVPFIPQDKAAGAFLDWYLYEGAPSHALWSRYHVFGIKDGTRLWKVQVLTYYGERSGAPVSGLYTIRYAELTSAGSGPAQEVSTLDGTAGGPEAPKAAPSECLDLGTGARTLLTPDAALNSTAWHLCFRRQSVGVNGEIGGPRGVGAVDLDADKVATEALDDVKARTAESEKPKFDAADGSSFDGKAFRGDRIVSGFAEAWLDRTKSPIEPAFAAWLVVEASGTRKFLLAAAGLDSPTEKSPGTVVLRVKPVGQ